MQQLDFDLRIWPINLQEKMFWSYCCCCIMKVNEIKDERANVQDCTALEVVMLRSLLSITFMSKWNIRTTLRYLLLCILPHCAHTRGMIDTWAYILKCVVHIPSLSTGLSHHSLWKHGDSLQEFEPCFFHAVYPVSSLSSKQEWK